MIKNSGQVLIESLIAISLGMVGLLGILSLVSHSLYLQNDLQQQFSANYLAAEGIELTRSLIDEAYKKNSDGSSPTDPWGEATQRFVEGNSYEVSFEGEPSRSQVAGSLQFLSMKNGLYGYYKDGTDTIYKRDIKIEESNNVKIHAISTVYCTSRGEQKSLSLENFFYNWR